MAISAYIRSHASLWAVLSTLVWLQGCAENGKCVTEASSTNTYNVIGKWKKISGYVPSRSKADLELNYEYLIVEPGTKACLTTVVNTTPTSFVYYGDYTNSVPNRRLTLPDGGSAGYSFSGSCGDTKMTLSYSDGTVESYKQLADSNGVTPGDCTGK